MEALADAKKTRAVVAVRKLSSLAKITARARITRIACHCDHAHVSCVPTLRYTAVRGVTTMAQRFLVKVVPGRGQELKLGGVAVEVRSEPLFASIKPTVVKGGNDAAPGLAAQGATWHIVEPALAIGDTPNPWDVCHEMVSQQMGVTSSGTVVFAEPDLAQKWMAESEEEALAALGAACTADPQDAGYPTEPKADWYRDANHGQYGKLAKGADGAGVRIAHMDTGYDPNHASCPVNLELSLAKNFVDKAKPDDASDETSGIWTNRGHGTGTLSILAGAPVPNGGVPGVAPKASIVPIRVANRVVLFNNSSIAKAFDYIHALCQSPKTFVDVVTMSMGGLASQAWAEAVNALYDAGVFVVTAAGNNFANLPTRNIVYPARFNRVIAACGAMADQKPYADLGFGKMAGNYGPDSKMRTAMAAYTPNIPWARFGCEQIYRFDGAGTSSATPQVAATAALYIQANRAALNTLPKPWMRVEAVRKALFSSAASSDIAKLGNGVIRAADAMAAKVAAANQLEQEKEDSASFGLLRVLTGLGLSSTPSVQQMLELESLHLSQSAEIETLLPDPSDVAKLSEGQKLAVLKALAEHPSASRALKAALQPAVPGTPTAKAVVKVTSGGFSRVGRCSPERKAPIPSVRRLRVYTYDPSLGQSVDTFTLTETVAAVRWEEDLKPGPVGEYLEVVDVDPASGRCYRPVDLNHPRLLASDGLTPSEANPQFHQQMVYAVAMRTIAHFERALGRRALWAPHFERVTTAEGVRTQSYYVQRLRVYPHALRARNAYYSPQKKALLLGYFTGSESGHTGDEQTVFTALSSDIIAHETTHALLDGLHRRFREPTNDDVLAFHEAFADIVALFQHFSLAGALRDALRQQIAKERNDFTEESLLSGIAVQFGRGMGQHGALRTFVGKPPSPKNYSDSTEPHARGSVLVAAVFDAFLQIYKRKSVIPIRLATAGSEVLPQGVLQGDLVDELAKVATSVAGHVLQMCIRALDYCPPVDITFGDFLRAVVTADKDLVPEDPHGYRVAFASSFRARGIYPEGVRTVSVDTLCWEPPLVQFEMLGKVLKRMSLSWDLESDRHKSWNSSRVNAWRVHQWLTNPSRVSDAELELLGLHRHPDPNFSVKMKDGSRLVMDLRGIEVHSVRPLQRVGPDGQLLSQMIVELTQSMRSKEDEEFVIRGGCTLILDLTKRVVTYMVRKRANQFARIERQQALWAGQTPELQDLYRASGGWRNEPFAFLHGLH